MEDTFEQITTILEEIINEISDKKVEIARREMEDRFDKASLTANSDELYKKIYKAYVDGDNEEFHRLGKIKKDAEAEMTKRLGQLKKFIPLEIGRMQRKTEQDRKIHNFKKQDTHKMVSSKNVNKAEEEHNNALINQGLRNKLEGSYKKRARSRKEPVAEEFLNVLEAYINEVSDFGKFKRKKEIADEVNQLMQSGETDKVKQTPTGGIIGDPDIVRRLNNLKKELKDLEENYYIDDEGNKQYTLPGLGGHLNGRNIQQENKEAEEKKKAEKDKPKNPNRVAGGKRSRATMKANKTKEFYSRPLIQKLGMENPEVK